MKTKFSFQTMSAAGFASLLACLLAGSSVIGDTARDSERKAARAEQDDYQPKTDVQLRRQLSRLQYEVTQNEATEPAFQNRYWNNKQKGVYYCVVCDKPLFSSDTKFKSGTGWPSFWNPLEKGSVGYRRDFKLFYTRIEVHCKRCGAHLGHVFDDGPKPTGKRYCMNSASLKFLTNKQVEEREEDASEASSEQSESESDDS